MHPSLQMVAGQLPSEQLDMHLVRVGLGFRSGLGVRSGLGFRSGSGLGLGLGLGLG